MNQPASYRWRPIEELAPGCEAMASGELRALSEVWLEQRGSLQDSASPRAFSERLRRQWAIEIERYAVPYRFFVDSEMDSGSRRNWYRWQTIEAAHQLEYFANTSEYNAWVRLALMADTQANIILSFTAIGREYRGLIGGSLYLFRTEEVEDGQRQAVDVTVVSEELFQINYKEEEASVGVRFERWLDRSMTRGLEVWRRGL